MRVLKTQKSNARSMKTKDTRCGVKVGGVIHGSKMESSDMFEVERTGNAHVPPDMSRFRPGMQYPVNVVQD
jgi:hypothetical protein